MTLTVGSLVRDANVTRIYGVGASLVGVIRRIYDAPLGMAEVQWSTEDDSDGHEDVWLDELISA